MMTHDQILTRLLVCNGLGIRFYTEDGRIYTQYLMRDENPAEDFVAFRLSYRLKTGNDLDCDNVVSYSIVEALEVVDKIVMLCLGRTLEQIEQNHTEGPNRWGLNLSQDLTNPKAGN